jgi:hypothetical protein
MGGFFIMSNNEVFLHARKRGHSVVENTLLDDTKVTMQAKYLLIQFCSHRIGEWKIQMEDIIKRSKNGKTAHYTALTELIHNKYVARVKVTLKGKFVKQIYVYGQVKEDVAELLEAVIKQEEVDGHVCRVEFGEPLPENLNTVTSESSEMSESPFSENLNTVNRDTENLNIINNQGQNTNIQNINNNKDIDDDKRTESSAVHNEEELNEIINCLREATKDELTDRSFKSVLRKVMDKYKQGKIGEGKFRDYLVTSLTNKIDDLEKRRIKEEAKSAIKEEKARRTKAQIENQLSTHEFKQTIPFYNWLED